jgi:molybdopterin converting factor small subunit
MNVLLFGVLIDVVGKSKIEMEAGDVDSLKENLFKKFPALKKQTFQLAVNKELVNKNMVLNTVDEIVLLPPYSGG